MPERSPEWAGYTGLFPGRDDDKVRGGSGRSHLLSAHPMFGRSGSARACHVAVFFFFFFFVGGSRVVAVLQGTTAATVQGT